MVWYNIGTVKEGRRDQMNYSSMYFLDILRNFVFDDDTSYKCHNKESKYKGIFKSPTINWYTKYG